MAAREWYILDTGPLLELLVIRYQESFGAKWPDPHFQIHSLVTSADVSMFTAFLAGARGRLRTTAGVVAEMNRTVQEARKFGGPAVPARFWSLAREEFRQLQVDERLVRLLDMQSRSLSEFGPTDASLLALADAEDTPKPCTVLTGDSDFFRRCGSARVEMLGGRLRALRRIR